MRMLINIEELTKRQSSGAVFENNNTHRMLLWRIWNLEKPPLGYIMLNPSTADAMQNDRTIDRCLKIAEHLGYGSIYVANLFTFRTPKPAVLRSQIKQLGASSVNCPDSDEYLRKVSQVCSLVIAGWGNDGELVNRGLEVCRMIINLYCLRVTSIGMPQHPLFLPTASTPVPYHHPLISNDHNHPKDSALL